MLIENAVADNKTFLVQLTPPGRAAVAVVLVAGPDAMRVVADCFIRAKGGRLEDLPLGQIMLGRWPGAAASEELVVCRRALDRVEVHCHGGTAAVRAIVSRLTERGGQQIAWQEWLQQSCDDPIRAAARIALAEAPTAVTAAILLDQYHGALSQMVGAAIADISLGDWLRAAASLDATLAFGDVGQHLTTPWRVILAGPTNVGKSSLINALAGFPRSIVSHEAGTTRDVVTLETAINGWPVQLADTAGLRVTQDELESAGVGLALASLASADLVLAVGDAADYREASVTNDPLAALLGHLSPRAQAIRVLNKIDLLAPADRVRVRHLSAPVASGNRRGFAGGPPPTWATSAVTGEGISDLVLAIGQALVPVTPPAGSAVPFTAQQRAALTAARAAVSARDTSAALAALQALQANA